MTVQMAEARLKAAQLRVLAASQRSMASSYLAQAARPSYDGQSEICATKSAEVQSLAERTEAEADLIIAKAEAAERGEQ
jgi:hypothetical protein